MFGFNYSATQVGARLPLGAPALPATPEEAASAYFAAMTVQPDETRKGLISTLISAAMSHGWWDRLDWLVLLASHDAQAGLVNARAPAKSAIPTGGPAFAVDLGYSGDGVSAWLSAGEPWAGGANQYSQDSATLGVWCNQQLGATGIQSHMGHSGSTVARLRARDTAGSEDYCLQDNNVNTFRATSGSRVGHRTAVRSAANEKRGYFNGQSVSSLAIASLAPSASAGSVLRGGSGFTADQMAAFYSGRSLSAPQVASLHGDLFAYLSAIGAA